MTAENIAVLSAWSTFAQAVAAMIGLLLVWLYVRDTKRLRKAAEEQLAQMREQTRELADQAEYAYAPVLLIESSTLQNAGNVANLLNIGPGAAFEVQIEPVKFRESPCRFDSIAVVRPGRVESITVIPTDISRDQTHPAHALTSAYTVLFQAVPVPIVISCRSLSGRTHSFYYRAGAPVTGGGSLLYLDKRTVSAYGHEKEA